MRLRLTLVLLFLVLAADLSAQYRIDSWTAESGLPQNALNRIIQTRDGFIWIATFAGLVRYDGSRFVIFDSVTPGFKSSRITDLFEDREGNLWASTEGHGITLYKDGVFRTLTAEQDGLPDNLSRALFYDSKGSLLMDSPKGLYVRKGSRFAPYASDLPSESQADKRILRRVASGAVWYQEGAVLRRFENGRVTQDLAIDFDLKWLYEDSKGRLWIEFEENKERFIKLYQDGKTTRFSSAAGIPRFRTMSFFEDPQGTIWLGLKGDGGLLRFKDGKFVRYSKADGLPGDTVGTGLQDREGTLWFPTSGGLARFTERSVTPYSQANGLAADNTYPVYKDSGGVIWTDRGRG